MVDNKYYCLNCETEIKSTDTVCPNCGKNLKEVNRRVEATMTASAVVSSSFEVRLTKEQQTIVKKVLKTIKKELAKKKIASITFGFPQLVSVKIVNKEDSETKSK